MSQPVITIDERDLVHIMRVVLGENRGSVLTDSLCLGIEASVLKLLRVMPAQKQGENNET